MLTIILIYRPRPRVLTLRVLVDRSVIEGFAQHGRATIAMANFGGLNATAVVWTPHAGAGAGAAATPTISLRVWSMRTGYREAL